MIEFVSNADLHTRAANSYLFIYLLNIRIVAYLISLFGQVTSFLKFGACRCAHVFNCSVTPSPLIQLHKFIL